MSKARPAVVFALALLPLLLLTHGAVFRAGNDASRWALVEALVERGESAIEGGSFAWTVDRVTLEGRSYSNKPPLLALAAAAIYAPLSAAGGWSLGDAATRGHAFYWVTLLLVGLPCAWLAVALDRFWGERGVALAARNLAVVAASAGTILTSFATSFNNHTVAAVLLFAAALAAWRGRGFAAGGWLGLAGAVDLVPGFGFAPFFAWWLEGRERRRFLFGLAPPLALFFAANLFVMGSPLPPKMVPGAVDQSASFAPAIAGVLLPEGLDYPLSALFGWHGFFSVSPVLLFGAWGLGLALRDGARGTRRAALALALGIACQVLFHVAVAGSFGGWSYGFRYLIPVIPLLLAASPRVLAGGAARVAFGIALAWSMATALLGAYHPWPPGYEQESAKHPVVAEVTNPIGANLAAWLEQHAPGSAAASWAAERWVSRNPEHRQRYFAYFFWSKGDSQTLARYNP